MKNFKVINGVKNLGYIKANNLAEVEVVVAVNFPEDYFGCNIYEVDKNGDSFVGCDLVYIPIKEFFGQDANAIDIAANHLSNFIREKNNLMEKTIDSEETILTFPKLDSLLESL